MNETARRGSASRVWRAAAALAVVLLAGTGFLLWARPGEPPVGEGPTATPAAGAFQYPPGPSAAEEGHPTETSAKVRAGAEAAAPAVRAEPPAGLLPSGPPVAAKPATPPGTASPTPRTGPASQAAASVMSPAAAGEGAAGTPAAPHEATAGPESGTANAEVADLEPNGVRLPEALPAPSPPPAAPPAAAREPVLTPPVPVDRPPLHPVLRAEVVAGPGEQGALHEVGVQGRVRVRLLVRADGTVGRVEVRISSGDADLDAAAVRGLARWRFAPARRDGIPIDAYLLLWVTFRE